ncbi:unnamed protein product, partial [Ectocarpus sp. 6 AP-2014]
MSSSADQQQPADASSTSTATSTSTFEAAKNGDADFIQAAILDGVDVNKRDSSGESALMIAAQHGHEDAVRWLAVAGARTEDTDNSLGTTALMF